MRATIDRMHAYVGAAPARTWPIMKGAMRAFVLARRHAGEVACAGAILVRLWVMLRTAGTNDIHTWLSFAIGIRDQGLFETYRSNVEFNHPPLMGLWALAAGWLSGFDVRWFPFVFKLMPFAGDALAARVLYRDASRTGSHERALRAAGLFLWNPASLIITAYHGNTDPLMAALCLCAALAAARGRPLAAALALGGAVNVKVVALVLLVPLACSVRSIRGVLRFARGFAVMCLPFVPVAALAGRPMIEHVFKYNSTPGMWGLNLVLTDAQKISHVGARLLGVQAAFLANARYAILGVIVVATAWTKCEPLPPARRWVELAAFALCLLLVLAPGFGFQYLAWPMPLLFALDPRRAAVTSAASGVFLGVVYFHFWNGLSPATSWCGTWPQLGVVCGAIVWLQLVQWVGRLGRALAVPRQGWL